MIKRCPFPYMDTCSGQDRSCAVIDLVFPQSFNHPFGEIFLGLAVTSRAARKTARKAARKVARKVSIKAAIKAARKAGRNGSGRRTHMDIHELLQTAKTRICQFLLCLTATFFLNAYIGL